MTSLKTVAIAAALALGAASMAMAQAPSTTGRNAEASGGAGTHSSAVHTGSAANTQKTIQKNQNGYRPQ